MNVGAIGSVGSIACTRAHTSESPQREASAKASIAGFSWRLLAAHSLISIAKSSRAKSDEAMRRLLESQETGARERSCALVRLCLAIRPQVRHEATQVES